MTERFIDQLREVAQQEQYDSALDGQLKAMEARLEQEKADDLTKHRAEVSDMLRAEILTRYYFDKGRCEGALRTDPVVARAVEELSK